MHSSKLSRPFAIALLATAVLGLSGCFWKKGVKGDYALAPEMRPLEVPPDLNLPSTAGAMQVPAAAATAAAAPAAPTTTWFNVAGDREATFAQVGEALAAIPGVTITSKTQLLGAYDVSYEGANFLVRVVARDAGSYVSAVDPRGLPATGEAPVKLVAALKEKLGG